jgi:mRNA-degrading endonuclease RelE of RelBE toxin-antitoxin system
MSVSFRIADSFSTSLARLSAEEQKLAKTTAFDLQLNPANPGHQFHKLDRARDPRFWSVRVSSDIRIIVHRSDDSLLLCYVDHHDDAYRWAERRKIEVHPKTGAAQIVEIRELVQEIYVPKLIESQESAPEESAKPQSAQPGPPLFSSRSREELSSYGVPEEWVDEVLKVDEPGLFDLASHLPAEAGEALLELATGGTPVRSTPEAVASPFEHPDALRRFRTLENVDELREALDYPMEKWSIFLHPSQRDFVEREFSGPARVSGSAGTGKTVVALHRALHLLKKYPEARVLLTTFSPALASQLNTRMRRLLAADPRLGERLEVSDFDSVAARLHSVNGGQKKLASRKEIERRLYAAIESSTERKLSRSFLEREWWEIVDSLQVRTWETYRDVKRLGRKTRLPEEVRLRAWQVFSIVLEGLVHDGLETASGMFRELTDVFKARNRTPFDFVVVDEAQDVSMPQLQFLSSLPFASKEALFFAGDIGQRVFQYPFSWLSQGIDIRGRSRTLKVNYRTSHQIRAKADLLLNSSITDTDGQEELRSGTVSIFNGPRPEVQTLASAAEETSFVATWLRTLPGDIPPHEIAIIVREDSYFNHAAEAAIQSGHETTIIAKGLEFRAVVVMGLNEDVIPAPRRIEEVSDPSDIEEIYNTERQLLYVACTRAREHLLLTAHGGASEFLTDLSETSSKRIS